MQQRTTIGFTGTALLAVGAFLPLVSLPIVGSITSVNNGQGDGMLVLVLAAISGLLVAAKRFRGLWLTGLVSLALIGFTFLRIQSMLTQLQIQLADNPFRGLMNVQLQWGWAVLILGVALLLAAAGMRVQTTPIQPLPITQA